MKVIKSILIVSFLFVSALSFSQPPNGGQRGEQQGPPPIPNAQQIEKMVSDLADELSLSDEQESSVLKLYTQHFKEVKEKTSGNKKPERKEMEAMKSEFEKKVKSLLSAEQQTLFDDFQKKNQPHHGHPGKQK